MDAAWAVIPALNTFDQVSNASSRAGRKSLLGMMCLRFPFPNERKICPRRAQPNGSAALTHRIGTDGGGLWPDGEIARNNSSDKVQLSH